MKDSSSRIAVTATKAPKSKSKSNSEKREGSSSNSDIEIVCIGSRHPRKRTQPLNEPQEVVELVDESDGKSRDVNEAEEDEDGTSGRPYGLDNVANNNTMASEESEDMQTQAHAPRGPIQPSMQMTEEEFDIEHHKQITARRNFDKVNFGQWQIKTWFVTP
jgi:hypothetical protein